VVIAEAVSEDRFRRVARKALKFEIGLGKESATLRSLPFYREENVEMRVDLIPDFVDFNSGRISAEQVASEKARMFRQIIGRKLMIRAATCESALVRGHTDDRAALVVLVQGFDMPEGVVEFLDGRAVRLQVVQPLCPVIVDQARALPVTTDHPLDLGIEFSRKRQGRAVLRNTYVELKQSRKKCHEKRTQPRMSS
jgi:hypothetical protein